MLELVHWVVRCSIDVPLRVPVSEVFKSRTLGLGINGKIEAGAVRVGTRVWILPAMESATVKGIEIAAKVQTLQYLYSEMII